MKKIILFMLVLRLSAGLSAQIPEVLFEKSYSPTYSCRSQSLVEADDNGFLLVGWETLGDGNVFASVVRTDSAGNEVWSKAYGNPWGEDNKIRTSALDVVRSPNGNYVISGEGEFEGVVVDGRELPYNNGYIFEIDDNGVLIWEQSYRLEGDEDYRNYCDLYAIDAIPDGGYVAAGQHAVGTSTEDPPRWNGYLVIINENGEKIREISYESGDEPSLEWFDDVKATSDGGFIVSGFYSDDITVGYVSDGLVVKFDKNGLEEWHYVYNTEKISRFRGIVETSDTNFVAVGAEQISPLESNLLIYKLSADGELIDSLLLHNYDHNGALDLVEADNGYLATGYVYQNEEEPYYSQAYLLKLNSKLAFEWELLVGGSEWEEAWAVIQTSDGGYAFAGIQIRYGDPTTYHHYLVKVSRKPGTGVEEVLIPVSTNLYQNYPNPFNPVTTIAYQIAEPCFVKLSIYDISGRLVETLVDENKSTGVYTVKWDAFNIVSGVYFYKICAGDPSSSSGHGFINVKKCLVVK